MFIIIIITIIIIIIVIIIIIIMIIIIIIIIIIITIIITITIISIIIVIIIITVNLNSCEISYINMHCIYCLYYTVGGVPLSETETATRLATRLLPAGHWIGCNEEMKFDLLSCRWNQPTVSQWQIQPICVENWPTSWL